MEIVASRRNSGKFVAKTGKVKGTVVVVVIIRINSCNHPAAPTRYGNRALISPSFAFCKGVRARAKISPSFAFYQL